VFTQPGAHPADIVEFWCHLNLAARSASLVCHLGKEALEQAGEIVRGHPQILPAHEAGRPGGAFWERS